MARATHVKWPGCPNPPNWRVFCLESIGGRRICEPAGVLDRLRWLFPLVVALVLPLAGVILVAARFAEGDRDEARYLAAATLLGVALYALVVFR